MLYGTFPVHPSCCFWGTRSACENAIASSRKKTLDLVEIVFFSVSVLVWPQVIRWKLFKFMEIVFGISESRNLRVEYPSVRCVMSEDVG